MKFHIISISLIYLFSILIIHLFIRYHLETNNIKYDELQEEQEHEHENPKIIYNDNKLQKINKNDELIINDEELNNLKKNKETKNTNSINKDFINYLDQEKEFKEKLFDNSVKENNYNDINNIDNDISIDKYYNFENKNELYSFNPVPTSNNDITFNNDDVNLISNDSNKKSENTKIFDDVEPFDDLNSLYASI